MAQRKNESVEEAISAEYFSKDGIFQLEAFPLFKSITNVINFQVNNNHAIVVTSQNKLFWFSTIPPLNSTEVEISRQSDDLIHNLFLDPFGWHVIVSMQSGTNFYTNRGMKKVRQMIRAKDILIDSVAWNLHNVNESSTQEILIGTNDGHIYETLLLGEESRFLANSPEQYWKQLTSLGNSVTGLEIIRHPPGSPSVCVGEPQRCAIFATTPNRLYQFAGWINTSGGFLSLAHIAPGSPQQSSANLSAANVPSLDSTASLFPTSIPALYYSIFHPDDKLPAGSKVTEFPKSFGYSDLKLYKPPSDELPNQFAWMTGSGIYFGRLNREYLSLPPFTGKLQTYGCSDSPSSDHTRHSNGQEIEDHRVKDVFFGRGLNLARDTKLIPYPIIRMLEHTSAPLSISLTAFHTLVIYADRIKAVNVLDTRTVYSMPIASELGNGRALGICRDQVTENVWLFGHQGIARLKIKNELCRVWQIYLDQLKFEEARKFCQGDSQLDVVNIREAEHYFNQGDFMKSAKLFAKTSVPFEEVALRFSQLSLKQQTPMISSSDVLVGKAVTGDNDVIDAISSGVEDRTYAPFSSSSARSKSMMENSIDLSTPLKVLISGKLDRLSCSQDQSSSRHTEVVLGTVTTNSTPVTCGQVTLLTLWLVELLLNEIGFLQDRINKRVSTEDRTRLQKVRCEFKELFRKRNVLVNLPECKDLLYDLISSHGDDDGLIFVADLMRDYVCLVNHYMRLGMYKEALSTFARHPSCSNQVYDHSMTLALHYPEKTVNMWLQLGKCLDVIKLLPAVMLLPPEHAMHYLQTIVDRFGCRDQAVHNLLASLCADAAMAEHSDHGQVTHKDPLLTYLESASLLASGLHEQVQFNMSDLLLQSDIFSSGTPTGPGLTPNGVDSAYFAMFENSDLHEVLPYDPGFVLRKCKEVGHLLGMVFILKLLGMHHQALKTAIEWNDIQLAKEIARTDALSQDIRRQLWLTIARHVINEQSDMQEATSLLRECPLLKLEDILPYFQDSVTIDHFKDAICASLDSYHQRIDEVKRDMHTTMQSTNALRKQLDGLRHRHEEFDTDSRCTHCNQLLILRPFYVFPCGHHFHTSCLIELVQPHLTTNQDNELMNLIKGQNLSNQASSVDVHTQLDELIASDCVSCGQLAITNIANLIFKSQSEYDKEMTIWL